ncbi:Xylose isomerase [Chionoecetes opilio]|uniref:Xylose isomerase n=1 Tax=Chionoecetes opilio TaxID=41210 RepID=A0A8J5CSS3_CHIOP|nr:Xylose isomerase [Chionoecetes opilio]
MAQAAPKRQKTANATRESEFFPASHQLFVCRVRKSRQKFVLQVTTLLTSFSRMTGEWGCVKVTRPATSHELLAKCIGPVVYKPDAGASETLVFRHYNAQQEVMGRTMEEWLRFSVCYWHSFRGVELKELLCLPSGSDPFGGATIKRSWDDGSESLDNAKRRLRAAFEFFTKLGVKYWTFHDRDVAPEGKTLAETNANLDEVVDVAADLMKKTGVKLLWATCNMFAHPRFMHGAATSCDSHVTLYAAAQVKKGLEVAKRLGAENFVFWGGREGYHSLANTNVRAELDHLAAFYKMVIAYKEKIGFKGQLLIEPKPKEPTRHQYDYDAQTVMAFLHQYGLSKHFKLNIEPNHTTLAGHPYEHDVIFSSAYDMLGSIDANTGSPDLGWDTDQFPMDVRSCTMVMKAVLEQDGIAPGGLNFDAKVRRESTALKDLFIAHVAAMDTFARGLKNAAKMISEGVVKKSINARYVSWKSGVGARIAQGEATLEECEKAVAELGDPHPDSGQQEHFEAMINHYI